MNMNKVIVVSGPPCSGKTFFLNQIKTHPAILNKIGRISNYNIINANYIRNNPLIKYKSSLIVHYDCMRSFKRGISFNTKTDAFLKFISLYDNVCFIYIICPVNVLYHRMVDRLARIKKDISSDRLIKLKNLIRLYADKCKYKNEYLKWYEYSSKEISSCAYFVNGNAKNIEINKLPDNSFYKLI